MNLVWLKVSLNLVKADNITRLQVGRHKITFSQTRFIEAELARALIQLGQKALTVVYFGNVMHALYSN